VTEQRKPKILTLDIETKPAVAYVWRLFKENIPNDRLIRPDGTLCVGTKWMGEDEVNVYSVWEHGEKEMFSRVLEQINEADAIITYNGDKFDMQHLMVGFIKHNLPAPAPVTHIDLFKFVRNKTKFMSKKLNFVAQQLGIGEKEKHSGFQMWVEVMEGKPEAQKEMAKYCAKDVVLTEQVYERLKGYIPNHPSLGFTSPECCPTCGSSRTQRRGRYFTRIYQWQRHQCTNCGSWFKTNQQKIKSNE
jgi:DNA polymerase elongation subunit (family B)